MVSVAALILALVQAPAPEMDIVFSRVGGEEIKMDIYRPTSGPSASSLQGGPGPQTGKYPAVVVIHGGAWMGGSRKDMAALAERLAGMGVVAANITYRLAPKHKWPAMLDDVQTAVRFLRANASKYGIDPKRIGAAGASAGGHLSVFLGVTDTRDPKPTQYPGFSSKVQAVLDIFGPTDLTDRTDFPPGPMISMLANALFGKKAEDAEPDAKAMSPYYLVTQDDAPTFIFQGLADPLVKANQSRKLEKKLKELGIRCDSAYVEGMGHEMPLDRPAVKEAAEKAVKWFLAELRR